MILVRVATVLGTFGVSGQLKLASSTDHPEWLEGRLAYLLTDPRSHEFETVRVVDLEQRGELLLARLEGYDSPEAVKRFTGWELYYSTQRGELPREEGEVYFFELPGLEVRNPEGVVLGTVVEASHSGAHVVLEISGLKQLLPFTAQFVTDVDLLKGFLITSYPFEAPAEPKQAHQRRRRRRR